MFRTLLFALSMASGFFCVTVTVAAPAQDESIAGGMPAGGLLAPPAKSGSAFNPQNNRRPDTLVQTFVFDPNVPFEIRCRVNNYTNIVLPEGEIIHGFYLSDTVYWVYVPRKDLKSVLVRPKEAGRFTSGIMVTNKRTYQLVFRSYRTDDPYWYQTVRWHIPQQGMPGIGIFGGDVVALSDESATKHEGGVQDKAATDKSDEPTDRPAWSVNVQSLYFGYRIEGSAPFRPSKVFDDGTFTYLSFPDVQDLPAIFVLENGESQLVDYVVRDGYVLVHRVSPGLLLKLGREEVRIVREAHRG